MAGYRRSRAPGHSGQGREVKLLGDLGARQRRTRAWRFKGLRDRGSDVLTSDVKLIPVPLRLDSGANCYRAGVDGGGENEG
jgi:hypothetical protein